MDGQSTQPRKAQLDKEEREYLEDIVTEMRDRVEANVRYQLEDEYDLDEKPDDDAVLSEEQEDLVEAIELEAVDGNDWEDGYEEYITGVGYTIVNRLAALRCMEVRNFINNEITTFRDDGLTPAADRLVTEEFMLEEEAVLEAYRNACDELAEEIEILFDRSTAYSLIDPDDDTFEDICRMFDKVADEVWRADDVLGWVYEYYNRNKLAKIRKKARNRGLDIEDIAPANQFYTPHWVVRMLADNSLGKYYQESTGGVQNLIEKQASLSSSERINRPASEAEDLEELCTYMVSDGDASTTTKTSFEHPSEIQVIDPACGSGHFLLYCFDILERIWWIECPKKDKGKIPELILKHNLHGVDIDLRACQLAAFNLYLKARGRADEFGNNSFNLPDLGIVCSDANIAEVDSAEKVFDEVAEDESVRETLQDILDSFEDKKGLGSLLDVRTALSDEFLKEQTKITDDWDDKESLSSFLDRLRKTIKQRDAESFLAQDLRSFLRLLAILSDNYDIALMNPPYGSQRRMPESVKSYVRENYQYHPEYYINFFEVCERLVKEDGRIGMLVPRSFMFNQSFEQFRSDFIGERGNFDFLAEFGLGILDNATVRTAGTVVRAGRASQNREGTFFRLHDVEPGQKESAFVKAAYDNSKEEEIQRLYRREMEKFRKIPGAHISYWMPDNLREIYDSEIVFDSNNAGVNKETLGVVKQGTTTGNNSRFVKYFWEQSGDPWVPFAKGGEDAWILPRINQNVLWGENGEEIRRYDGSVPQNTQYFFKEALTYTVAKETGRRFGYLHPTQAFDAKGSVFIPDRHIWDLLGYSNSQLITYLMLCQTPERMWQVGMVSKLPWDDGLAEETELDSKAKEMMGLMFSIRKSDLISPYFESPLLLQPLSNGSPLKIHNHPHRDLLESVDIPNLVNETEKEASFRELGEISQKYLNEVREKLENNSSYINNIIYNYYDVSDQQVQDIRTEIELRTAREFNNDEEDSLTPNIESQVKDLIHYLVLDVVMSEKDGIVPIEYYADRSTILDQVVEKFEQIWGEYAEERLAEADQILGNQTPDEIAYPNLKDWIKKDLFSYHIDTFKNTPVLWKMTTERLLSDADRSGFSCFVDFHQLGDSLFDQISNRYLEANKSALRERRSSANQRQSDDSLSTSERSEASEEFEHYTNALEQLTQFEEVIQDLSQSHHRDWSDENQKLAKNLQSRVEEFRNKTEEKLAKLDELSKMEEVEMDELFTPTFYPTVEENRTEWIRALDALESSCQAYSKPHSEPVEAHHHDLFTYFDDLIGSTHFASNGILFITHYLEQGEDYLENGEPREGLKEDLQILAELAVDIEQYIDLAKSINQDCQELSQDAPTNWRDRAVSDVTTEGYKPVYKYGVTVNIQPLVDAEIVPEVVEDKVL